MLRLSLLAFVVGLVDMPCGTTVVTRRGVSTFTCVDVVSTTKGLYVTCFVAVSPASGLVFCTVVVYLSTVVAQLVCKMCYGEGFRRYGCRFV